MISGLTSRGALALCLVAGVSAAALASPLRGAAAGPTYALVDVGAYGGEPSITSDSNGILYYTSPSTVHVYRSADKGNSWGPTTNGMQPDPSGSSGDDCLATDESNSLYWCNLNGPEDMLPLQADVFKDASNLTATHTPEICTTSCTWTRGLCTLPAGPLTNCVGGSTSGSPFGVDRQWTAASLLNTGSTSTAEVVFMYHDFYGPSEIWVNVSTDGGAHFGTPVPVIPSCLSTGCAAGAVIAQGYQMCNTVPTGVAIVPQKLPNGSANPNAGRVYVSWIAADPTSALSGCNVSMAQAFHTIWVAYSDNASSATPTWTAQQMVDQGLGHDASTPFAAFTLDNNGNPYVAFAAPAPGESFVTCHGESATGMPTPLQSDPSCDYHMWVVACVPSGTALSGLQCGDGLGTIPSSAGAAHEVDTGMTTAGTDVFPTIAVGDPGKVDVSWLNTNAIVPTDALGKFAIGGCSGSPTGTYVNPPAACPWNLMQAQSLDFNITSAAGTWTPSQLTSTPMHVGDICNLGIACVGGRNLLDFNQETIDPTDGCAHISFPDDNTVSKMRVANQVDGPSVIGTGATCGLTSVTPEAPIVGLLLAGGGVVAALTYGLARRRRAAFAG